MFGSLLPATVQQHVLRYLPTSAWDNVIGVTAVESSLYMAPWTACVVLAGWLALCGGAALRALYRVDS